MLILQVKAHCTNSCVDYVLLMTALKFSLRLFLPSLILIPFILQKGLHSLASSHCQYFIIVPLFFYLDLVEMSMHSTTYPCSIITKSYAQLV